MKKRRSKYERHSNPTALVARPDMTAPTTAGGRIAQILLNVDLRNSHEGLMDIAKRRGLDINKLEIGQYIVFVNDAKDRFKIFAPAPNRRGAIVAYYRSFDGRIDREAIESLPSAFGQRRPLLTNQKMAEKLDQELAFKRLRTVKPL